VAEKRYNFAKTSPEDLTAISVAHFIEYWINRSTSSKLFSAWRQILTRSFPLGTVGQAMGRAFSPRVLKRVANERGYDVIRGTIGVGSCEGDDDADGWRCSGRERILGLIGVNERRSRSARVAVRYLQRAKRWCESCKKAATSTKQHAGSVSRTRRAYLVGASRLQEVERAVNRDDIRVAQGGRVYQRSSVVYQILFNQRWNEEDGCSMFQPVGFDGGRSKPTHLQYPQGPFRRYAVLQTPGPGGRASSRDRDR